MDFKEELINGWEEGHKITGNVKKHKMGFHHFRNSWILCHYNISRAKSWFHFKGLFSPSKSSNRFAHILLFAYYVALIGLLFMPSIFEGAFRVFFSAKKKAEEQRK